MRRGFTLVEIVIGVILASILIGAVYGLFHVLMWNRSRSNIVGLTGRTAMQMDAKIGVRRMMYRLREAIQILSPAPGITASELVFRDLTNAEIRVRLLADEQRVVSERLTGGAWVRETDPVMMSTASGPVPATWPIVLAGCKAVRFTPLSPDCVTVHATLTSDGNTGSVLTMIRLRNAGLAY